MRYRASKATIKQQIDGEWQTIARCFGGDPETNEDRASHMAGLLERSYLLKSDNARLVDALSDMLSFSEPDSLLDQASDPHLKMRATAARERARDLMIELDDR